MGNIVVPTSKRISQIEAMTKQAATAADVQAAKSDFIAMMCDVDLSMIEDDETEVAENAQQEV